MLELYLAIGLIGLGVLANKNTKDQPKLNVKPNLNLNQKNIYENNIVNKINSKNKNNPINILKKLNKMLQKIILIKAMYYLKLTINQNNI